MEGSNYHLANFSSFGSKYPLAFFFFTVKLLNIYFTKHVCCLFSTCTYILLSQLLFIIYFSFGNS